MGGCCFSIISGSYTGAPLRICAPSPSTLGPDRSKPPGLFGASIVQQSHSAGDIGKAQRGVTRGRQLLHPAGSAVPGEGVQADTSSGCLPWGRGSLGRRARVAGIPVRPEPPHGRWKGWPGVPLRGCAGAVPSCKGPHTPWESKWPSWAPPAAELRPRARAATNALDSG